MPIREIRNLDRVDIGGGIPQGGEDDFVASTTGESLRGAVLHALFGLFPLLVAIGR